MFFESFDGHSVIFTTALSPVFPFFSLRLGMKMSCTNIFESLMRKA